MRNMICLLALLLVSQARGQSDYAVGHLTDVLKNRADAVVRHETINVDMQSPTRVRYAVKRAITVFNRAGEAKARLVLHYDKSTAIKRIAGRVFDANGFQTGKFSQRDFRDESAVSSVSLYEDSRRKHFLPSVTSYPFTVEYDFEVELKQNLIIPAWRPNAHSDVAVEHSEYTFVYDPAEQVRIRTANYEGAPESGMVDGRKVLSWRVNNMPARRQEPYGPDPETYVTTVRIAPVEFSYYKHKGRYTDWNELGHWMYGALLSDGRTLPAPTVQEVRSLVAEAASDKEKARILYDYLQRKTRYVSVQIGIGGFKPMPASEVDRLGYGDCKALVNYMQALLDVVDIPSYYCVVQAGNAKRDIQADFAGMEQGNHVILCIPFANDTTWLECTSQRIPFGYLGTFTDDRTVWACTPEGGRVLRTPGFNAEESTQVRQAVLTLGADGTVAGSVKTVFSAGQYDNHLEIAGTSGQEQLKLLKEAYDIDHITFSNIAYDKRLDGQPELEETFEVNLDRYAPENDGQVFLETNVFNRRGMVPEVKNRTLPLYINRGYTDEDQLNYTLPEGYLLISGPTAMELDSPFGRYETTVRQEGNQLLFYRRLTVYGGTFASEKYEAFREFMNRIAVLDNQKSVLARR